MIFKTRKKIQLILILFKNFYKYWEQGSRVNILKEFHLVSLRFT